MVSLQLKANTVQPLYREGLEPSFVQKPILSRTSTGFSFRSLLGLVCVAVIAHRNFQIKTDSAKSIEVRDQSENDNVKCENQQN